MNVEDAICLQLGDTLFAPTVIQGSLFRYFAFRKVFRLNPMNFTGFPAQISFNLCQKCTAVMYFLKSGVVDNRL